MLKGIWDFIRRLFGLEKKGVDEKQMKVNAHYAGQYEEEHKLNFTAIFAQKLTTLAVSESTADIDGENARVDFIRGCLQAVWEERKRITSRMLGTGGCALVPYVKDGVLLFDIVPQDRIVITEKIGERITGAVVLADRLEKGDRAYYRLVDYRVEGDTLSITNRIVDDSGNRVTVTEWEGSTDHRISGVDRVLFSFFRSPIDNRRTANIYGVPVTFGCEGLIKEIRSCLEDVDKEFKNKKVRVFADERLFRMDTKTGKRILPSEAFVAGNLQESKSAMEVFSPEIRDSSYYNRLVHLFELLEKAVGTSKGILTAPESRGATATEIKAGMYDTYTLVADIRTVLEKGLREYCRCCDILANYYGLAPRGEYDVVFDWSYSMIESSAESWAQLKDAQAMGIKSRAELRQWLNPNETLEEAEEKVAEIQKNEPSVRELLGE